MAIIPHTADIVVKDMAAALGFYRHLGLAIPAERDGDPQVEVVTLGGWALGFLTEAMQRSADPDWPTPVGQRVTLAFRCDAPAEVDATYERLIGAGHAGKTVPWDAFWGQRYASVLDPDGNRVDLFAALG